jgi:hypothetical protein
MVRFRVSSKRWLVQRLGEPDLRLPGISLNISRWPTVGMMVIRVRSKIRGCKATVVGRSHPGAVGGHRSDP